MEGTPPGDAPPPPPQRATPARKGARWGAGAGFTRPHRPHPGHTGRGTLAARSRGQEAGGGTAPDTRRPSQRWKAPPPGTPFRHPHSEQQRPVRTHAVGPVLGPHARIDRTRDTRVAEPRPPAPEDGRSGEGQRLTPGAPHNTMEGTPPGDALPPPPQRATPARKGARCGAGAGSTRPHRPHPGHTGRGTLAARSRGRAAGGGTAPDTRRPSQRWKAPPPGTPFRHPHSEQQRPVRTHAVGPVLGPHARIDRTRDTRVAEPRPPAPEDGRSGEGQRLTPGAPHNTMEGTPPGDALPPPPQRATPARKGAHCGAGAGSTRPHRPHPGHTGRGTLAARSGGWAAGGGTAPDTRRPSQQWKAPPLGTPFRHPHSEQQRPVRTHAVGPVLGPHARIDRTRDTRVAEPRPPAPEDGRSGEGQRLTPGAPHNTMEGTPPGDALPPPPQRATPARKGARWGAGAGSTRPYRPHPGHTGLGTLAARSRGRAAGGGTAPDTRPPFTTVESTPPRGRPSATPTASNASPQGLTLWGR